MRSTNSGEVGAFSFYSFRISLARGTPPSSRSPSERANSKPILRNNQLRAPHSYPLGLHLLGGSLSPPRPPPIALSPTSHHEREQFAQVGGETSFPLQRGEANLMLLPVHGACSKSVYPESIFVVTFCFLPCNAILTKFIQLLFTYRNFQTEYLKCNLRLIQCLFTQLQSHLFWGKAKMPV